LVHGWMLKPSTQTRGSCTTCFWPGRPRWCRISCVPPATRTRAGPRPRLQVLGGEAPHGVDHLEDQEAQVLLDELVRDGRVHGLLQEHERELHHALLQQLYQLRLLPHLRDASLRRRTWRRCRGLYAHLRPNVILLAFMRCPRYCASSARAASGATFFLSDVPLGADISPP
jgi:hypothetical protein